MNLSCDALQEYGTFAELLEARAQEHPDRLAYTFLYRGEREAGDLTYADLDRRAKAIAATLQQKVATGDRALMIYPPGLPFIEGFFGCLYAGVVPVPAYPPRRNQKMSRLTAIVTDADAKVVMTDTSLFEKLGSRLAEEANLANLPSIASDAIDTELARTWVKPAIDPSSLALLQYTSGSTGTPKGVEISHRNLLHNSTLIRDYFEHSSQLVGVIWLPPFHDMGLIGGVLQPIFVGAQTYLMSPIDFLQKPFRWLQAISQYKATTSGGPNFAYELCLRKVTTEQRDRLDLSSWRIAFNGAEPVRAETLELFAAAFATCGFRKAAFYPCYGMAETTLIVSGGSASEAPPEIAVKQDMLEQNRIELATADDSPKNSVRLVSSGRVSGADRSVAIVDPENSTVVPEGTVGEIWVRSPSVAGGYWKQPETSAQTFRAYRDDDGSGPYLRTGDLGVLLAGELFVTGRLKDVIIIRGRNYYPQDIEAIIENSHPAFKSSSNAAFTVTIRGEEKLVAIQEIERRLLKDLDTEEALGCIRQTVTAEFSLSTYATVLIQSGSIPKTSSGKIQRFACRQQYLSGSLNSIGEYCEDTRGTSQYLQLQSEIESVYQSLMRQKPSDS